MQNNNKDTIYKQTIWGNKYSINKNNNKNNTLKLFPYLSDKLIGNKLKIDDESKSYISIREHAEVITNIIKKHVVKLGLDPDNIVITDSTAGVGGNTLSFAKHFSKVNAIEINDMRADYLQNNIDIYDFKNVSVYHNNYIDIMCTFNEDIVFVDPPWGGKNYKYEHNLKLHLSDISLEDICNKLMNKENSPKLIVLKLPKNYDITFMYKQLTRNDTIYFYDIDKMFIIVIVNNVIN